MTHIRRFVFGKYFQGLFVGKMPMSAADAVLQMPRVAAFFQHLFSGIRHLVTDTAAGTYGFAASASSPTNWVQLVPLLATGGAKLLSDDLMKVTANTEGYKPDKIMGKPGEKLTLVFTRTADSSCIAQLGVL